jgi:hypothetical protein
MDDSEVLAALERDWRPWVVTLTCCGRDNGEYPALTWQEADEFRNAYLSGPAVAGPGRSPLALMQGHDRSAIITGSPAAL